MGNIFKTLFADGAALYILQGLWTTVLISALGLLIGTIFGGLLCFAKMSKKKAISFIAKFVIAILRGSPIVLLLMILYYVVFANIRIDPMLVAFLGFGLNSGAHIAEIMYSAITAVNKKQIEAGRMLGLTKFQAFRLILLPQSYKIARPVYQNAIISLIQWTSVVGYVSITDLTRTVNSIGNRIGNPFLSLFIGIILYLALSYAVYGIFYERRKKNA